MSARLRAVMVSVLLGAQIGLPAGRAEAKTTVSVKGTVVTITVPIDAPNLEGTKFRNADGDLVSGEEYWEQSAESIWNEAFKLHGYRCFELRLNVDVTPRPIDYEAVPGRHQILYANGSAGGIKGSVLKPNGDTTAPFTNATDGMWGNLSPTGVAHEVGHLLGLGDDYREVSQNPRKTEPIDGRQHTLMADGGPVDQVLVDRIGDLITKSGVKLPQCWTGTMKTSSDYTLTDNPAFRCSTDWETALSVVVSGDGTLSGDAVATLVGGRECTHPISVPQTTLVVYSVTGHAFDDRLEFQLDIVDAEPPGSNDAGGFLRTIFSQNDLAPVSLMIPITALGVAEGDVELEEVSGVNVGASVNSIRLTCESCEPEAVG